MDSVAWWNATPTAKRESLLGIDDVWVSDPAHLMVGTEEPKLMLWLEIQFLKVLWEYVTLANCRISIVIPLPVE